MRKSKTFHQTDISKDTMNAIVSAIEINSTVIVTDEHDYLIFSIASGKPVCLEHRPIKNAPNIIFFTTEFIIECKDGFCMRCIPLTAHFKMEPTPHNLAL